MAVGRYLGLNIDEMGTPCRYGKQKNRMVWLTMCLNQRLMCLMERLFSIFFTSPVDVSGPGHNGVGERFHNATESTHLLIS